MFHIRNWHGCMQARVIVIECRRISDYKLQPRAHPTIPLFSMVPPYVKLFEKRTVCQKKTKCGKAVLRFVARVAHLLRYFNWSTKFMMRWFVFVIIIILE